MYYKQQISEVMFNLLDSHDTERILWTANEDVQLVKSALAFFFLQKGTPCIYYGTELALTGGPDPDCRRCMPWERVSSDNDMLNFMKRLIKIRKYASVIISHGKYSLQEIKSDLVSSGMEIRRTDPQSNIQPINRRLSFRERSSSTSKQLPRIGESACHLSRWICDFLKTS